MTATHLPRVSGILLGWPNLKGMHLRNEFIKFSFCLLNSQNNDVSLRDLIEHMIRFRDFFCLSWFKSEFFMCWLVDVAEIDINLEKIGRHKNDWTLFLFYHLSVVRVVRNFEPDKKKYEYKYDNSISIVYWVILLLSLQKDLL